MPLRSVKMNGFIRGSHLFVRCPKWTPLSSRAFIEMTAIGKYLLALASACFIPASDCVRSVRSTHWKVSKRVRLGRMLPVPGQNVRRPFGRKRRDYNTENFGGL